MYKNIKNTKGITLAELVLVIGIIAVLTAIFAGTYRSQSESLKYTNSLNQVVSMIKTARNYAVTSRAAFVNNELVVPPEGYGLYIERSNDPGKSKLVLFANVSAENPVEKADQFDFDDEDAFPDDVIEEEYYFPVDTIFEAILMGDKSTPIGDRAVIIFRPPIADAFIANNDVPDQVDVATVIEPIDIIYFRFSRRGAPEDVPDKFIKLNKTAGFPEAEL
jgi:type II secretory pathway pseudopilin PulG